MQLTPAQQLACRTFADASAIINEWIAGMGGWDALPAGFSVSGGRWTQAETEIEEAAGAGDIDRVRDLGQAYILRVMAYCVKWEAIMDKSKEAA